METVLCSFCEAGKSSAQSYPSQLAILSNVLILHQPRDGWACYSHILAGFWLAATRHPCWMWLPHPRPCVESLTPIGWLPRQPRRDPYMINLTDSWLPEQRHPPEGKGPHMSCCQGPRKSAMIWQPPPGQGVPPHQAMTWPNSGRFQLLSYKGSPKHGKGRDTGWVYHPYHTPAHDHE